LDIIDNKIINTTKIIGEMVQIVVEYFPPVRYDEDKEKN
jgi:hypothetical protein